MNFIQKLFLIYFTSVAEDKARTCQMRDLTTPMLLWPFEADITCVDDKVFNPIDDLVKSAKVGTQCTYSYSCPLDLRPGRQATLRCEEDGKWSGYLPDCDASYQLADSIVNAFGNKTLGDFLSKREEGSETESSFFSSQEEEEGTEEPVFKKSASPSKSVNINKSLGNRCDPEKTCENITSKLHCFNLVPKSQNKAKQRLRVIVTVFCLHCYDKHCSQKPEPTKAEKKKQQTTQEIDVIAPLILL
ncbi:unnamed protein product [Clavelina lepadiformis]|uniref:Sushi domain-containing protein n=1 Tax=Clavelina lepadiformis TaxID=159417 RepID=A0ABP0FDX9_CLALP